MLLCVVEEQNRVGIIMNNSLSLAAPVGEQVAVVVGASARFGDG